MKISFLGTGTSQGIPVIGCRCKACSSLEEKDKRLRTSCMIEVGTKRIIIDVGPDFRQQMLREGGKEIHAILISHEHNDHVAGLDDVRPFNFRYTKDMPVYGLPRVMDDLEKRFDYIFEERPYPGAPIVSLNPISGNEKIMMVGGIEIIPIHIIHGDLPILGYRVRDFAYLTDVKTVPEKEFEKLTALNVLVLSAVRDEEHHSHLTLEQAIGMAKKIGAKETYFTHFSHLLGTHENIVSRLPKGIYAAYDGLQVEL